MSVCYNDILIYAAICTGMRAGNGITRGMALDTYNQACYYAFLHPSVTTVHNYLTYSDEATRQGGEGDEKRCTET